MNTKFLVAAVCYTLNDKPSVVKQKFQRKLSFAFLHFVMLQIIFYFVFVLLIEQKPVLQLFVLCYFSSFTIIQLAEEEDLPVKED